MDEFEIFEFSFLLLCSKTRQHLKLAACCWERGRPRRTERVARI